MSGEFKENSKKTLTFISFAVIITAFIVIPTYSPILGSKVPNWIYDTGDHVFDVEIAFEGSYSIVGTQTSILLFDKFNFFPIWEYTPVDHMGSLSISSDGKYFAGVDWDNLYVFTREGKSVISSFVLHESYVIGWHSVDISLNGKYFVATNYKTLYLFSTTDFLPIWNFTSDEIIWKAQISEDGSCIAAIDSNHIYMFSRLSNDPLWNYPINHEIYRIELSSNGMYLATKTGKTLLMFNTKEPIPIWVRDLNDYVSTFSISSDGSYIMAGSRDGTAYLFKSESPNPIWVYNTPWPIGEIAISADGKNIAIASTISYACLACVGCPCPPSQGEMYFFNGGPPYTVSMRNMGGYIYSCSIKSDGDSVLVGCSDNILYCF